MATEAQRAASARHNARLQAFCVRLRKDADADVISWLKAQDNVAEAVRRLVRREIEGGAGR